METNLAKLFCLNETEHTFVDGLKKHSKDTSKSSQKRKRGKGRDLSLGFGYALVHLVQEFYVFCSCPVRFCMCCILEGLIHATQRGYQIFRAQYFTCNAFFSLPESSPSVIWHSFLTPVRNVTATAIMITAISTRREGFIRIEKVLGR